MNLAYLANIRFPSERAHSVQIDKMCTAFARLGHHVTVYASSREAPYTEASFSLVRLYGGGTSPRSAFFFYLQELLFSVSFFWNVKGQVFDAVVSRSEFLLYLLSFTRFKGVLLWESHDGRNNFFVRRLAAKKVRIVFTSEGQQSAVGFLKSGCSMVAPNGIDSALLELSLSKEGARSSLGLDRDTFLVGYIGGFDTWKGIETFFEASKDAPDGICFVAIGGTETELLRYRSLYPRVTYLGQRPYEQLAENQQAFDVLVIPNTAKNELSAKYTSPLKLFAHMASGVPIVASDIPSITTITGRELVTLVNPDDPVALVNAVLDVKDNYTLKHQNAAQLRAVAAGYTWDARAKKILAFLGYTS